MAKLLQLYTVFFKIGLFTFGGGYAMLPVIEREVVDKYHWITQDELLEYLSLSQCTPGVIAVNTSTFVGSKLHGFWGAVFATLGVITPSVIIISVFAGVLTHIWDYPAIEYAFAGIRPAVAALIVAAFLKILKRSVKSPLELLFTVGAFIAAVFFDVPSVVIVIIAAVCGVIVFRKEDKGRA